MYLRCDLCGANLLVENPDCTCSERAIETYERLREEKIDLEARLSRIVRAVSQVASPCNRQILDGQSVVSEEFFSNLFKALESRTDYVDWYTERLDWANVLAAAADLFYQYQNKSPLEKLEHLRHDIKEMEDRRKEIHSKLGFPVSSEWKLRSSRSVLEEFQRPDADRRTTKDNYGHREEPEDPPIVDDGQME